MEDRYWVMLGTAIGVIVAAMVGGAAALVGGVLSHWWTLRRDREARGIEWERQRIEAERKNLRELQEALKEVIDAAMATVGPNLNYAATGKSLEPDTHHTERSDAIFARACTRAQILESWLSTRELRSVTHNAMLEAIRLSNAKTFNEAAAAKDAMHEKFSQAVHQLGKAARDLSEGIAAESDAVS